MKRLFNAIKVILKNTSSISFLNTLLLKKSNMNFSRNVFLISVLTHILIFSKSKHENQSGELLVQTGSMQNRIKLVLKLGGEISHKQVFLKLSSKSRNWKWFLQLKTDKSAKGINCFWRITLVVLLVAFTECLVSKKLSLKDITCRRVLALSG